MSERCPIPAREAFSLIDLVAVMALLGVVCSVALPRLVGHRTKARVAVCLNNCSQIVDAGLRYASDNTSHFPGSVVHNRRVMGNNLFGKTGRQAWLPGCINANQRALTSYLEDPWNTGICPLDYGTQDTVLHSKPYSAHVFYGLSYVYFERTQNEIARRQKAGVNGVWAIEGHRIQEVAQPDRKLFIADEVIRARHSMDRRQHRWHNGSGPLSVGIGFVDGHAANLPRHEGIGEGEDAWPSERRVISDTLVQQWSRTRSYY